METVCCVLDLGFPKIQTFGFYSMLVLLTVGLLSMANLGPLLSVGLLSVKLSWIYSNNPVGGTHPLSVEALCNDFYCTTGLSTLSSPSALPKIGSGVLGEPSEQCVGTREGGIIPPGKQA